MHTTGYHSLAGAQNLLQAIVGAGFEEVAGTESVNKDIKVAAGSEKQILSSTWMAGEDRSSMPWSLADAHGVCVLCLSYVCVLCLHVLCVLYACCVWYVRVAGPSGWSVHLYACQLGDN